MKRSVLLTLFVLFFCITTQAQDSKDIGAKYFIEVSITECKMRLYKIENSSLQLVKEYQVGTVKKGKKDFPLGKGVVTEIKYHPEWNPTENTRKEFAKRGIILPDVIPSGHPLNYMGSFKIYLSHTVPGKGAIYRIHGSRKEDEDKIGHRVSGGCIRMRNAEGEELSRIITVGTVVNITL